MGFSFIWTLVVFIKKKQFPELHFYLNVKYIDTNPNSMYNINEEQIHNYLGEKLI